jgi:uncharacterized protein YhaN
MKLRQVHINQFGHFSESGLELTTDGLQLIYGPNEAGKTTLLQFLRGWLFDFPARTPYDFKDGTGIAGVGTMVLSDGRTVELRRRKGTKNKVNIKIDGQDSGLDEIGFQRLIGHANRSLFESIFAFGLDQLSQGEESLKHESLQSALFGGGLGIAASPERILQDLERQASELFNPTAKKPIINLLLADLKSLTSQIKEKSLRSDDYLKCCGAVSEADALAAELHRSVDQLRRDHARLEKLCRAHQKWQELQQYRSERAPLSVPRSLSMDARARHVSLSEKIQSGEEERGRLGSSIASLDRDLAGLKLNPAAVSYRAEIRACLGLKQSFLEAKADLPKLTAEHAAARRQIDRELDELRRGWTHEDLRAFAVDVVTQAEIDRLIEQDRSLETTSAELRVKREQLSAQLRQSRADLEGLGELKDVAAVMAVLADESAFHGDRKLLEQRSVEVTKIDRQLTSQLKKLSPPLPAGAAVNELPVPHVGTIKQFEADFADLREQQRALHDSLQQDEGECRDVQDKLNELISGGAIPSLSEQDSARQLRDAAWETLRRHVIEPAEPARAGADLKSMSDSFEQSIRDADAIADRIYANANAVVRREELGRQRDRLSNRLAQKQERVRELQQQELELQQRWVAAWDGCGFVPLAPDAMRSWVGNHEVACETISRRDEIQFELEHLSSRIASFEARLRAACDAPEADTLELLARAQQSVDVAKEQHSRDRELKRDIKRLEPQLAECDADLLALSERQSAWRKVWKSVLSQLRLPVDLGTESSRTVLGRLRETRVKLDNLPQEEGRLAAMQSRLDEFTALVASLCEALAPESVRDAPELAIEELSDQLERAAEAQKQFDQLHKQREDALDQLNRVESRQAKLIADRTELFAAAQVETEMDFLEVVARAEKIRRLDDELERRTHEIELIRAGEDREEFERALSQLEPEILDGQRRDLADRLSAAEQLNREADRAAGVAKSELARLDGSGEAAILTDQLSRKRSHLAAEVDRYVPLIFARHLLNEAVRRFERENQPEMVATVSRLIGQMTAGRYTEFDRTTGNTQGILVRRYDGVERTPDQLSSGTREQLYLAIRLAYVLHYCRQNEPLPIVMDDVLVNFDDDRVRNTLATLADVAQSVQILFFTCHPHMVALAREMIPGLKPIDLPSPTSNGSTAASA